MRGSGLVISGLLGLLLAIPTGPVTAQSPSAPPSPSVVPVVGPDGMAGPPSPAIGPEWTPVLERPLEVLHAQVVACGDGFVAMAFGHDRKVRGHALAWVSADGLRWESGEELRPRVDRIDRWSVQQLVVLGGRLYAIGGDGRHLAVWRSADCGASWRRLRDPAFALGRDAIGVNGLDAAATDTRILVMGRQAGEDTPARRWAWVMESDGGWRRIPGALNGVADRGLASTGAAFVASGPEIDTDATQSTRNLVTSSDGETWTVVGLVPDPGVPAVTDVTGGRLLFPTEEVGASSIANQVLTSTDAAAWDLLAQAAPMPQGSSGDVTAADGVLVWIVDAGLDDDDADWSWVGVSRDGGATWEVSAGWPWMTLRGTTSVAANDDHVVLLSTGPRFDAVRIHVLPR